jgi:hypothetical protein
MWRRKSCGSKDIFRFREDARPQEWRQSLDCHKLHPAPETFFEQLGKSEETGVRLGAREKLDQEVDITVETGPASRNGTEKSQPLDT